MTRPTLTLKKAYFQIKPEELVFETIDGVKCLDVWKFYEHPIVKAMGIDSLMDDYMNGAWASWLRANILSIHCYAADREDFFKYIGVREAKSQAKPYVYMEDLS